MTSPTTTLPTPSGHTLYWLAPLVGLVLKPAERDELIKKHGYKAMDYQE